MVERNWAGNVDYGAANFHNPTTVAQVQSIVAASTKARGLGSRHSFNTIADTTGDLISLSSLERSAELDTQARTITVDGGIKYGELATLLDEQGWALANLASLPHISVAGACATGTHGSGVGNGGLATAVQAMDLVTASGDLVDISRDDDPELMDALTVGLGAFGIVTRLTLSIEPTFQVRQRVYEQLPMATAISRLGEIMDDGYSVSLFTSWRNDYVEQLWRKERIAADDEEEDDGLSSPRFGAMPATRNVHPIVELSAEPCTEQMGVAGPWHERLPHFRMGFTPSSGEELQSELFVASTDAPAAIQTLIELHDVLAPVLMISEVRAIAADTLWLSPCYRRDCIAFHFTWIQSWSEVQPVLATVESALQPFAPRPHWGKLSTLSGEVIRSRVERMGDFERLLAEWDPGRKFRNDYLEEILS
ncbi:MAG: FAD-binding protein [Ilumatobacteraceae bacterium]|nr:FAD-binding protein [Ilumatobacteraceae bacterium]